MNTQIIDFYETPLTRTLSEQKKTLLPLWLKR